MTTFVKRFYVEVLALLLASTLLHAGSAPAAYTLAYDDDGMVTVNGERTLILGTYYCGSGLTGREAEARDYDELADTGFNLVRASATQMDLAHRAGLMTWTSVGTIDPANPEQSAEQLRARVGAVKDHPSLAILETIDEPAWTWIGTVEQNSELKPGDPRQGPGQFVDSYPIIKDAAPNTLLYLNHAPTNLIETMRAYNAGTDIVAMDIYPVNPGGLKYSFALFHDGLQGDLNNTYISQVGEYVDKMRRVTGPNRPLLMVLQGFAWEMLTPKEQRREEKILYPSYAETRFMAFQSLIKGANGLVYWGTYYTPQPSGFWSDLKRVVREVADLNGPLSERDAALNLEVTYREIGHSVDDGIQVLCKEFDDKLYVFTCNADKNPVEATLRGFGAEWKKCRVLNETRKSEPSLTDGSLGDRWKRFDVHVYELSR
jgi:hypothetical protein